MCIADFPNVEDRTNIQREQKESFSDIKEDIKLLIKISRK